MDKQIGIKGKHSLSQNICKFVKKINLMSFTSTNSFIDKLKFLNEIHIIEEFVSPELEATEINDRIVKMGDGKAILIQNNGTEFPILLNAYGSKERINLILGTNDLDEIGSKIKKMMLDATKPNKSFFGILSKLPMLKEISSWMPSRTTHKALCQQEVMYISDLQKLPILKCWPFDGGKFITLPMVHTMNPETGISNVGMYRIQIIDSTTTAIHWHLHKDGARHFELYKKRGERMPVSIAIGGDPIFAYCASAPLPEGIDEYMLAGFLQGEKVKLAKCLSNDLYVPANADFVIEGYIDPEEDFVLEGPFGDHSGYYSLADYYPKFHVSMITHQRDAVYPATIVGVPPQEDRWMGKATERIFLAPIQMTICPDILDINLPYQGGFHNLAIVQIDDAFQGQAYSVMNALWGAGQMMFNKIMIIVPKNVNPHNSKEVIEAISKIDLERDILFSRGPADVLDHSGRSFARSGKIGIDATQIEFTNKDVFIDKEKLNTSYPEFEINYDFTTDNNNLLIIGINSKQECNVFEITRNILEMGIIKGVKFLLYFDKELDINNFDLILWQLSGNIDPGFDCKIINENQQLALCIDATSKAHNKEFKREWPNVILMNDKTITEVDKKWESYNLGKHLSSPSIALKPMVKNEGAVAED